MTSAARIMLADPQLRELLPLVLPARRMPACRAAVVVAVDLRPPRRRPAGRATELLARLADAERRLA